MPRTARPVQVDMYVRVCVIGFGVWTVSDSIRFVCNCPTRRRCHVSASSWAPGVSPAAPQFQLYVHCVGPYRARGGCRAPVSVSGVPVAQGAV